MDAVMVGADFEGKKQPIVEKHGYTDFSHMLFDQVRPVQPVARWGWWGW